MYEINLANRLLQEWVHFVTALASLLTGTECLVFQFMPSASISIQFVSKLVIILQLIQVLLVWMMIIQARTWDSVLLLCLLVRQFAISFNAFLIHIIPCRRTTQPLCVRFFPLCCSCRNSWFEHISELNNNFVRFTITLSASPKKKKNGIKKWSLFVKINIFHQFLPHGSHILLLSRHGDVTHVHWPE